MAYPTTAPKTAIKRSQTSAPSPLPSLGGGGAPASPSPSIASTTSATAASTPKKSKGVVGGPAGNLPAGAAIYSQPENTGVGSAIGTNIVYALDYLKQQGGKPVSLAAVLGHLNLNRESEAVQKQIVERMRHHPRIAWRATETAVMSSSTANLDEDWTTGTYEHKPIIPNVKDRTSLLQYLQRRTDAQGVNVKDLKDGWPDCEAALAALEKEHRVLVVRTKKDNHPRMVWLDDPSLCFSVEPEFQSLWHRSTIPSVDDIVGKLTAAGQKPTSEDPRLRAAMQPKEKKAKKRAQRRTGKSTNTHMEHLLKDYSLSKR
ncbi:transcription initiation factor TFIIE subunit beta [Sporothrix brasiliensis 5110]|uniref:Transcription initiation factor IIE subunit beta n=1 Tax=Sporothrix brasiliensis 5110 TaxID=1398154 RepID=A0A0C2J4A9_9PEZI|nr:transcription initiation factor TFIIE subunit beta [Sporothrix brasiliensis 5110]KIH91932.1 transcription initiation factor TFIIE subunit beta [Sporothrix brasiliensis 5110]